MNAEKARALTLAHIDKSANIKNSAGVLMKHLCATINEDACAGKYFTIANIGRWMFVDDEAQVEYSLDINAVVARAVYKLRKLRFNVAYSKRDSLSISIVIEWGA